MARTKAQAVTVATATPDDGVDHYQARVYHEIELPDGGVKRAEPGQFVVAKDGEVNVYPPEIFAELYPDVVIVPLAEEPVSEDEE